MASNSPVPGNPNNLGLVIGATKTDKMKEVKENSGNLPWLMPGVGFQGGSLEDSIKITSDCLDHIVEWNTNSSLPKIPLKIKIHMQNAEIFSLWWS